jgi:hypothetical protein
MSWPATWCSSWSASTGSTATCNVPKLQRDLGVVGFIREHLGKPVASTAVLAERTGAFYAEVKAFAARGGIPVVEFRPGQRKDDVMREHLARFLAGGGTEGVVLIGRAQEKVSVWATTRRRDAEGKSYPWITRESRVVTQWYFCCHDACAGPFFLKYCGYFPYNAKLCCNGNEYAKAMAARAGIGFTPLDNGFAAVDDVAAVQAICDGFDEAVIWDLAARWTGLLPCPYTADDTAAGYRYEASVIQAEFSLTQVLDRPVTGRVFFEEVIRENLDIGRPSQVQLIFDRRVGKRTPGRFRTRVITDGVVPSLHVDYKTTRIKQYHKEERALRTETTINNTRDFGIGKLLRNLPAVRQVGFKANRRLLDVQKLSHDCSIGEDAFDRVVRPAEIAGQRASALRFGDKRVQALFAVLVVFSLQLRGFNNSEMRALLAQLLGLDPATYPIGRMTYDLRRLRLHGIIERIPHSHRYQLTPAGLRIALFFSRTYARLLRPKLAQIMPEAPPISSPLRAAFDRLTTEIDTCCKQERLAA